MLLLEFIDKPRPEEAVGGHDDGGEAAAEGILENVVHQVSRLGATQNFTCFRMS